MKNFHDLKFNGTQKLETAEYKSCLFESINFTGEILMNFVFIDCVFKDCNLNMVEVINTSFQKVKFENCKLLGIRFDNSNPYLLEISFNKCNLNLASFYKTKLKNPVFKKCNLTETDFTEAHLSNVDFSESNLFRTIFEKTHLENGNFYSAEYYSLDPENNFVKDAVFSKVGALGLLQKYGIHIK